MGYGGSRADAAEHLGRSGEDEGLDGRINQDPLGLDQILVQANDTLLTAQSTEKPFRIRRFDDGTRCDERRIHYDEHFQRERDRVVQRGSNTKVVLIDGDELLNLMLRHHIGVRVQRQIQVLDLDQNYFSEEE